AACSRRRARCRAPTSWAPSWSGSWPSTTTAATSPADPARPTRPLVGSRFGGAGRVTRPNGRVTGPNRSRPGCRYRRRGALRWRGFGVAGPAPVGEDVGMRAFRFLAVAAAGLEDGRQLAAAARRAESMGFSGLVLPDHLIEQHAPVPVLAT